MNKVEKTLKENLLYDGKVVKLYVDEVEVPNGNKSKREYVKHPGGACCLAVKDGMIYFEKQYRYAYRKDIFELPAGKLEKGEDPKEAMIRELREEIGFISKNMITVSYMYPTCGYSNEVIYLFYSPENDLTSTEWDENEYLDIVRVPIKEAYEMLDRDEIHDAKTVILMEKLRKELLKD